MIALGVLVLHVFIRTLRKWLYSQSDLGDCVDKGESRGLLTAAPHDFRSYARLCHQAGGVVEQVQFLLSMSQSDDGATPQM